MSYVDNMDHENPEPPFTFEQMRLAVAALTVEKVEHALARLVVVNLHALKRVALLGYRLHVLKTECRDEIVRLRCMAELDEDPATTEPGAP